MLFSTRFPEASFGRPWGQLPGQSYAASCAFAVEMHASTFRKNETRFVGVSFGARFGYDLQKFIGSLWRGPADARFSNCIHVTEPNINASRTTGSLLAKKAAQFLIG